MKINICIDGSSEESANFIKALLSADTDKQKIVAHFVNKGLEIGVGEGTEIKNQDREIPNPFETVSWSSIHLYQIICLHHSTERPDCFVMTEEELVRHRINSSGATYTKEQLSRITGGARQTTNALGIAPILEIKNAGLVKEFCASKKSLEHFEAAMANWHPAYRKELQERGFYFPGEESPPSR